MTGIDASTRRVQLQAAPTVTGGGPATATAAPERTSADEAPASSSGSGWSTFAKVAGGALVAGAVIGGAALLLRRGGGAQMPNLLKAGLVLTGAAGGAAILAGCTSKPKVERLAGDIATADEARTAADAMDKDVAVVKADNGKFAVVTTDAAKLENHSAGNPSLPSRIDEMPVDSWVTRHGDLLERTGDVDAEHAVFVNKGVLGSAIDLDAIRIDPATGPGEAFTGTRIGIDPSGVVTALGKPVGVAEGYDTKEAAAQALFEAGIDASALVQVGGRTWAYAIEGGDITSTRAQGAGLRQLDALTLQRGTALSGFPSAGEGLVPRGSAATHDLASLQPDQLPGLRLGTDASGAVVRIGAPALDGAGFGSAKEAAVAAFAAEPTAPHAIVKVGDAVHAYALDGGTGITATSPLINPRSGVAVQAGAKLYAANEAGAVSFAGRTTPFDTNEPIGRTLSSRANGSPTALTGSFATRAEGRAAITDAALVDAVFNGTSPGAALVGAAAADGSGSHLYTLGGAAGPAWDGEMGSVDGVLRRDARRWSDQREEGTNQLYDYVYSQVKVDLDEPTGSTTLKDTGKVTESRTYNSSASSALKRRREEEARQREIERQREAERQRELARQRELERQREAERARAREIERQRQAEIDRQRDAERAREAERNRAAEQAREAQRNAERAREAERARDAERAREAERQRERDRANSSGNGNASEDDF